MKITLLRHGQPDFSTHWLKPENGANRALHLYAASRVTTALPMHMNRFAEGADVCVTSNLPRSIDSARILGFDRPITSALFNESELPNPNRLFFPMPWKLFLFLYRVLWFFDYKTNAAGKTKDRLRAKEGSIYLTELVAKNESILLVGHGIINRLICTELKKSGWQVVKKNGSGYWSSITLSK